ncbi:MAG: hypothetical protein DRO67_00225 [Candidatus Asgardarchaeum californiense]|nr:MAG: hypothetical protein DRO67_00225 [Candidatus Asgardarchaeum californiense]
MIDTKKYQKLMDMKLHEGVSITDTTRIMRVLGGWVYITDTTNGVTSTFVPLPDNSRRKL